MRSFRLITVVTSSPFYPGIITWKVGIIGSTEKRVKVITGYMNCSSS
ncbi:hypothetical protein T12_5312 [Trichinella patagoniensis]|uniref:Uncharacterized protein n=1 Tax=Trichinella patagoniensis TaxID=990121 RepID=A0A0V0W510_9BILA|nr:hypothetical protein T12_5312 [Trichinella patagoniensis]